jgi:phage gp29-like protein
MPTADGPPHDFPDQAMREQLRRPRPEREPLIAAAKGSQTNVARQKEVQAVSMTIAEALKAEGEAKGQLDDARVILQALLQKKFGPLPEPVRQRIQAATDLARLHAAAVDVLQLDSLEEFEL